MAKNIKNLGNDIIVTSNEIESGDWIIGSNGDFLTTLDYEQQQDNIQFDGQICLMEDIYRRIFAEKGSYIFSIDFGANISEYLSNPIDENLFLLEEILQTEILKDDRVASVKAKLEINNYRTVNIIMSIRPIGSDRFSNFIFPYNL